MVTQRAPAFGFPTFRPEVASSSVQRDSYVFVVPQRVDHVHVFLKQAVEKNPQTIKASIEIKKKTSPGEKNSVLDCLHWLLVLA